MSHTTLFFIKQLLCFLIKKYGIMVMDTKTTALVYLLEDPDKNVYDNIYQALRRLGECVLPHLENKLELEDNFLIQNRIKEIMNVIRYDLVVEKFDIWLKNGAVDLLEGMILLSQYQFPDVVKNKVLENVFNIKRDILRQLKTWSSPLKNVQAINKVLFEDYRFNVVHENSNGAPFYFLNYALGARRAEPILLNIFYVILAEEIGLPIYFTKLPNNVVGLCYSSNNIGSKTINNSQNIHFFIDPARKGMIFMESEVEQYLSQFDLKINHKYGQALDNLGIIKEYLTYLINFFNNKEDTRKIEELYHLLELSKQTKMELA